MKKLLMAVPKGRILEDLKPLFAKINLIPEKEFFDGSSRKLVFSTNRKNLDLVQVRSFDVATFVKFGAADLGICGSDVLEEFSQKNLVPEIFPVLDLGIGKCRLSLAAKISPTIPLAPFFKGGGRANAADPTIPPAPFFKGGGRANATTGCHEMIPDFLKNKSHIRIATKYTSIAENYFSNLGIQVEAIKLNGSIEIASQLNLCDFILDLVSTGKTLVENQMVELQKILDVSSHLVVNRASFKVSNEEINQLIKIFDEA